MSSFVAQWYITKMVLVLPFSVSETLPTFPLNAFRCSMEVRGLKFNKKFYS